MDHREEKELKRKQERKEDQREARADDKILDQERAKGTRIIHPLWLGAVGFILAMIAMLYWTAVI